MLTDIIPGGVGITQLAHIEDHFLHVVAVGSNLKFTNLQRTVLWRKVNPGNHLGIQGEIVEDHRADKCDLTRLEEKQ